MQSGNMITHQVTEIIKEYETQTSFLDSFSSNTIAQLKAFCASTATETEAVALVKLTQLYAQETSLIAFLDTVLIRTKTLLSDIYSQHGVTLNKEIAHLFTDELFADSHCTDYLFNSNKHLDKKIHDLCRLKKDGALCLHYFFLTLDMHDRELPHQDAALTMMTKYYLFSGKLLDINTISAIVKSGRLEVGLREISPVLRALQAHNILAPETISYWFTTLNQGHLNTEKIRLLKFLNHHCPFTNQANLDAFQLFIQNKNFSKQSFLLIKDYIECCKNLEKIGPFKSHFLEMLQNAKIEDLDKIKKYTDALVKLYEKGELSDYFRIQKAVTWLNWGSQDSNSPFANLPHELLQLIAALTTQRPDSKSSLNIACSFFTSKQAGCTEKPAENMDKKASLKF